MSSSERPWMKCYFCGEEIYEQDIEDGKASIVFSPYRFGEVANSQYIRFCEAHKDMADKYRKKNETKKQKSKRKKTSKLG